jgi:hypothetical protein
MSGDMPGDMPVATGSGHKCLDFRSSVYPLLTKFKHSYFPLSKYTATMHPTWQPPKNYRQRPVAILGAGVLGRRIGMPSRIKCLR